MRTSLQLIFIIPLVFALSCTNKKSPPSKENLAEDTKVSDFPSAMVQFTSYENNPVFQGTNADTWDKNMRERGYIMFEEGIYKMWYTGYNDSISEKRFLGYATSNDGIEWKKYSEQPIKADTWVEDMHVVKYQNEYIMLAEGRNDITHMLTSPDGITWETQGDITILKVNGEPISEGPYGTPTMWIENGKKYLFYERNDLGIWIATSEDFKTWTNIQDEAVLNMGPESYDAGAVATNQIIKHKGKYYMYYHGSENPDWMEPGVVALWTSNVAMSTDLLNWTKYPNNPIVEGDHSSPVPVFNGKEYKLFTTHDKVWLYNQKK